MILPGSLIPSDKYFLKNLTFVVRISTRVVTSPFQSNFLRGQGEDQQLKSNVHPGPTRREVMRTSSGWVRDYISTPSPTVQLLLTINLFLQCSKHNPESNVGLIFYRYTWKTG